ncbi:MAG: hypothetical protein CV087_00735 [Candidatus Brocadia sp. WS118]|nr:MAG: hypothetical protein CV087_00735 [Candidatus Brocadia sp. WS118]
MSTQRTVWVVIQSASGVIVAVASVITLMLMSINIYYQFVMKLHEIKVSILAETAMISGWVKDSLTFQTVDFLRQHGHDVVTAKELDLHMTSDEALLEKAKTADRLFIPRDKDYWCVSVFKDV